MKIEDSKSFHQQEHSVSVDEEEKKDSKNMEISKEREEKIKSDFINRLQNKFSKILSPVIYYALQQYKIVIQ